MYVSKYQRKILKELAEPTVKISGQDAANMLGGLYTKSELDSMYDIIRSEKTNLHQYINMSSRWGSQHLVWIDEAPETGYHSTYGINQRQICKVPRVRKIQKEIVKKFKDDLNSDVTVQFWARQSSTGYTRVTPTAANRWTSYEYNYIQEGIGLSINGKRYKTLVEIANAKQEGKRWMTNLKLERKQYDEVITKLEGLIGDDE